MIQTQQHSLSDEDVGLLKEWLISPGATLFLKVIRSEQAYVQAESAAHLMGTWVPDKGEANMEKAKFLSERAWELEFILRKFVEMIGEEKPYEFKTTTLSP